MLRRFCFLGNPFLKCRFCSPKMGVLESLINWFLVIFQLRCRKISWWGWSNWFSTRIHRFSARSTNIKNHCYPFLPCNTELSLLKFFIFWGSRLTILLDIHNMLAKGFFYGLHTIYWVNQVFKHFRLQINYLLCSLLSATFSH